MTTNNITRFVVPLSVKGFLVYHHLIKLYIAISSVIDLTNIFVDWKCFGDGWCLMDAFRLNYFIQSRQVHSNNRWHKFHIRKFFGCIWPDFTFGKMTFLMIPPTLPWCLSLQNQHNYLFKNIVPANNWKINPDGNWAPIPSLHKKTLMNDLPHSVSTVSIAFFRQLIEVILLWSEFSVTTTTLLFLISLVALLK